MNGMCSSFRIVQELGDGEAEAHFRAPPPVLETVRPPVGVVVAQHGETGHLSIILVERQVLCCGSCIANVDTLRGIA